MNEYERQIVGYYEVDKFEAQDSTNKMDLPTLVLYEDKTFVQTFKNKKISGKWEADDYGDWTTIDFFYNHHHAQGMLLGQHYEIINIISPLTFSINAKSFSFKRIESH